MSLLLLLLYLLLIYSMERYFILPKVYGYMITQNGFKKKLFSLNLLQKIALHMDYHSKLLLLYLQFY